MSSESYESLTLVCSDGAVTAQGVLASGAGALSAGCVLGKITVGTVLTSGVADPGNTGGGSCTGVAPGVDIQPGVYTAECVDGDAGEFLVTNPDGDELGTATVGVPFVNSEICLTLLDASSPSSSRSSSSSSSPSPSSSPSASSSSSPSASASASPSASASSSPSSSGSSSPSTSPSHSADLGDKFTVTVPAGSGKLTPVLSTAVNGAAHPYAILAQNTDASAADKTCVVYLRGLFSSSALTFGGSDTLATHRAGMRAAGLLVTSVMSAD